MRVLAFGDSITQGFWAVEHGWVDRLRMHYDALQFEDLVNRDEPTIFNLGISADTSEDLLNRIVPEIKARTRPHHSVKPIAIIQIGINDSSFESGKQKVKIEDYKANLEKIIDQIRGITSAIIFVGLSACDETQTRPVFWGEYEYVNEQIRNYETAMFEVAHKNNVTFIPQFEKFAQAIESGKKLLPDGLHPNDEGHQLTFEIIGPKIMECLK